MSFFENLLHGKSIKRLRFMLDSLRTRDLTLQYNLDGMKGEERKLAEEMNAVINEFREDMMRQENQYQYFETLLNTVSAMLIVADSSGKVSWMNQSAVEGLCGFKIQHLNDLAVVNAELPSALQQLRPGIQHLVHFQPRSANSVKDYVVSMSYLYTKGLTLHIYTIQNVQTVVQQSEAEAQQKLVRVLTHEIMNSLTPIISLSDTLCDSMQQSYQKDDDMLAAICAINRRAGGLLQFVENYRKLQHISAPQYDDVTVGRLLADLKQLYISDHIHFVADDESQLLHIDRTQIEQVLINLIKNALEATVDCSTPCITLSVKQQSRGREVSITVEDNGTGIDANVLSSIFVPFFTTKTGGSGIGLSICKQIISLHGGTISASSTLGEGTLFTILLPA